MVNDPLEVRADELLRRAGADSGEYPAVSEKLLARRSRVHEMHWPDDEELLDLCRVPQCSHLDCCKADFYAMVNRCGFTARQNRILECMRGTRVTYGEIAVALECSTKTIYRDIQVIIRLTIKNQGPQWRSVLVEIFGYQMCVDAGVL